MANNIKMVQTEKEKLPRVEIKADVIHAIDELAEKNGMTRSEQWEHALRFYLHAESYLQNMQVFVRGKYVDD